MNARVVFCLVLLTGSLRAVPTIPNPSFEANAAFANFSRQDEDEADSEGVTYMVRAGIDPTGIPEMFQILLSEREAKPGALDTWFRSHPLEESRIAAARARIAKLPPESLKGLTKDSPNFQAFKARIAALPPSPPSR